jgi:hypothetical protein
LLLAGRPILRLPRKNSLQVVLAPLRPDLDHPSKSSSAVRKSYPAVGNGTAETAPVETKPPALPPCSLAIFAANTGSSAFGMKFPAARVSKVISD